jgi:hypothetical protein
VGTRRRGSVPSALKPGLSGGPPLGVPPPVPEARPAEIRVGFLSRFRLPGRYGVARAEVELLLAGTDDTGLANAVSIRTVGITTLTQRSGLGRDSEKQRPGKG